MNCLRSGTGQSIRIQGRKHAGQYDTDFSLIFEVGFLKNLTQTKSEV
jgi:hypothetical protein